MHDLHHRERGNGYEFNVRSDSEENGDGERSGSSRPVTSDVTIVRFA